MGISNILIYKSFKNINNMQQSELKIGQEVTVIPLPTANDKSPAPTKMFVRELHNPWVAGLSYSMDSEHVYGIIYSVIHPNT